jgi:hypothetical protein
MILDKLALEIIEGKVNEGDKVTIDIDIKDSVVMTVK